MGSAADSLPAVNKLIMRNGPSLNHQQKQLLCSPVTEEEIYTSLASIGDEKAPVVKADVVDAVKEFFNTGRMFKGINCITLNLLPKIPNPITVKDFRPIACCTILYKLIAKVLAARLQVVMPSLICEAQAGFIPGRKIADNIILAHELVKAYSRKNTSARAMIKIDLQKAYDSVECPYLEQVMIELGFPDKFLHWIMACVKTVNYTILINGSTSEPFNASKGLRQASGLQPNLSKSSIYFGGVKQTDRDQILSQLGYGLGELPFKYLGIPLSTKRLSILQWQPLITKITSRIASWTAKKLSYAGRTQHVQSVIFGIQAYWAQLFPIPAHVLKVIDAYCRSYIWSGTNIITKKTLVAWDKVCLPISTGGLNPINLKLWNVAALAKTCWDLAHKLDKLWIRWIHTYYIKGRHLGDFDIPQQASWMVRQIIQAQHTLQQVQHTQSTKHSMIRTIYLQLLPSLPRVQWKVILFSNNARPKAKFIMWLHFHRRLLTADRLHKWGIQAEPKCVLCLMHDENQQHIFVQCPYTRNLWGKLLVWLQRPQMNASTWDQYINWIISNAKGKSLHAKSFKIILAECVYSTWIERNVRRFEGKSTTYENIAKEIAYSCYVRATPVMQNYFHRFPFE
ncbi:uncharacterized protein LOC132639460 [Lycium barbarum]|uniref:uncharacterized protein LOC132639460 n=1 Tax=Lycium barbarum TaxID=112863 RepID=UPI00293F777D|nr:uncharacterized protein LOC132639460 [Lycium barbarum]